MTQTTMSIRLNSSLSDFVAHNVSAEGTYDNVSEYVRDLIRQDKNRTEELDFLRLKEEVNISNLKKLIEEGIQSGSTDLTPSQIKEHVRMGTWSHGEL